MYGQVEPVLHNFIYWKNAKGSPDGDASVQFVCLFVCLFKFTAIGIYTSKKGQMIFSELLSFLHQSVLFYSNYCGFFIRIIEKYIDF